MKRFVKTILQYREYIKFAAMSILKAEVSGSFLSWLWWIFDPFFNIMVYIFMSVLVFGKSEPHFVPFVFVGQAVWKYVSSTTSNGVVLIRKYKGIISRIYVPKTVLLLTRMATNLVEFGITMGIMIIIAFFDGVEFSWNVLWVPYVLIVMIVGVFGVVSILMHLGVYTKDLKHIIDVLLRLTFYFSGVFYSIPNRLPDSYGNLLVSLNPVAMIINEFRNILIYAREPNLVLLTTWLVIGVLLCLFGIRLIDKNEQNYVKVI